MPSQMGDNSEQLQLKELLVGLEDEHEHLKVSINHLRNEIEKREREIEILLASREHSEIIRQNNNYQPQLKLMKSQSVDFHNKPSNNVGGDTVHAYSSDFLEQVDQLLDKITKTSDELSTLIKL